MKKVKWYDAAETAPKEGQHVTVLTKNPKPYNSYAVLSGTYEGGQYINHIKNINKFDNNKIALTLELQCNIANVIAWCDSNDLVNSYSELQDIAKAYDETNNNDENS